MVPRLVFVHGVGKQHELPKWDSWLASLEKGAKDAGHSSRVPSLLRSGACDVRFAYYGDLFDRPETQGNPLEVAPDSSDEASGLYGMLLEAVNERLAENVDEHEVRHLKHAQSQLAPEGEAQGACDILRRVNVAANALFHLPGLKRFGEWSSKRAMLGQLSQVQRYLARKETGEDGLRIDERVRARVAKELDPSGPTIVVAHSLGTVVSFETLHEHAGPVPLFVTLGSPIGLRTAVQPRMRPQPLCVPPTVEHWLNVWDRDDLVVGSPHLEKWVAPSGTGVSPRNRRVDSDGAWVHPAIKYLGQPAVAGPILGALEGVSA